MRPRCVIDELKLVVWYDSIAVCLEKAVLQSFAPAKIQKSVLYRLFRHPAMDSIKTNIAEPTVNSTLCP